MAETPRRVRGTQDIFGDEERRFSHVLSTFDRVRRLYCFNRVEVPVFEATEVFARSIGETTDVVSKEMYTFPDRGGDSLTLRPEFTAGIARAYLGNGWQQHAPMKLATSGAVFRYERPQKGRFRQFHQIDAEVIGAAEPAADVELLAMADQLLSELGIKGVTLQLNTLGDSDTRVAWRAALTEHFEKYRTDLSEDSLTRLVKNPLRILDSKDPRDQEIVASAPDIDGSLSSAALGRFLMVQDGLQAKGVKWTRNARLVRGLDYYRHTAFEFVTDQLGAQGTVLAGGRYDGLISSLGGAETPGVGWAAGVERLAMLVGEQVEAEEVIAIIAEGAVAVTKAQALTAYLRHSLSMAQAKAPSLANRAIAVSMSFRSTRKKEFERARKAGASTIITVRHDGSANPRSMNVDIYRSPADDTQSLHSLLDRMLIQVSSAMTNLSGTVHLELPT